MLFFCIIFKKYINNYFKDFMHLTGLFFLNIMISGELYHSVILRFRTCQKASIFHHRQYIHVIMYELHLTNQFRQNEQVTDLSNDFHSAINHSKL